MTNQTLVSLDDLKDLPPEALFQRWAEAVTQHDTIHAEENRISELRELLLKHKGHVSDPVVNESVDKVAADIEKSLPIFRFTRHELGRLWYQLETAALHTYKHLIRELFIEIYLHKGSEVERLHLGDDGQPSIGNRKKVMLFGTYEDVIMAIAPKSLKIVEEFRGTASYQDGIGSHKEPGYKHGEHIYIQKINPQELEGVLEGYQGWTRPPILQSLDKYERKEWIRNILSSPDFEELIRIELGIPSITVVQFENPHHAAEGLVRYVRAQNVASYNHRQHL